jgi:hypothetical protein
MGCMLCGTENREGAQKCKQCGSDLARESKPLVGSRNTPAPTILVPSSPENSKLGNNRKTEYISTEPEADNSSPAQEPREAPARNNSRKTHYVSPSDFATDAVNVSGKPRLVGFLVSYTWNASGDAFKIYDGKNSFGSSSAVDSPIPSDRTMSSEHFVVMARGDWIKIRDLTTTNATMVDGVEIWGDSADAVHGTKIKAGDTEFIVTLIP